MTKSPPADWLAKRLRPGDRLGYDPWLHTVEGVERLRTVCTTAGAELVAVAANLVDAVWVDRPGPPLAPLVVHEANYAGRDSADKRREVARGLEEARVEAAVLTAPESIAWLLNVRGGDVRHTPLPLSFALVHRDATVDLFVDARKVGPAVAAHLGSDVRVARARRPRPRARSPGPGPREGPARGLERGGVAGPAAGGRGRRGRARRRPLRAAEGVQERGRAGRGARRPPARRRRAVRLPRLARPRGPRRQADRGRRRRPPRRVPRRAAALPRAELPDDLRRRPQRRDRPLPGDAGDRPGARPRHALPRGLRRPVPGRDDGRHAHGRHRPADRRAARPLHARPPRPHRPGHGALPGGDDRRPARHARPRPGLGGGARLRPRDRPRRGQLPRRPRGPAERVQAGGRAWRSSPG